MEKYFYRKSELLWTVSESVFITVYTLNYNLP